MTATCALQFATELAQEAGQLALRLRAEAPKDFVATKAAMDFITHADQAVERLIRTRIAETYPKDAILGEEEGGEPAESFWIVDPIDGTTNYLKGLPDWGVCIARVRLGQITEGVIALPDQNRVATARRGEGAFLNGAPLRALGNPSIALVQLGYSARIDLGEHLRHVEGVIARGADYRRSGAACVGLLAVAAGWSDAYYERHLNLWDAAPGLLLIAEAGGTSTHAPLSEFARKGSEVLALGESLTSSADSWKTLFQRASAA